MCDLRALVRPRKYEGQKQTAFTCSRACKFGSAAPIQLLGMHAWGSSSNTVASRAGLWAYVKFVGSSGQRRSIYPLTLAVVDLRQFVSLAHTCYSCCLCRERERERERERLERRSFSCLPAQPPSSLAHHCVQRCFISIYHCMSSCDAMTNARVDRPCIASPSWLLALYK